MKTIAFFSLLLILNGISAYAQNARFLSGQTAEPALAPSATLVVTKTADTNDGVCNSDCSLREAVAAAAPGDTIAFASPLFDTAQTISINGQINLTKNLTINGRGPSLTTIRNVAPPGTTSRVLVNVGNIVNLSGLTITGGNSTPTDLVNGCGALCGGGIYNSGTLTITNSIIADNAATSVSIPLTLGGGIFNIGTLTLTNCTVRGNSVNGTTGNKQGGGIFTQVGTTTLINSTVSGNTATGGSTNSGAGVFVQSGTLRVVNSTLSGNSTSGGTGNLGGGIHMFSGLVTVSNSTLSANSAGASLFSQGGGIYASGGTLSVRNSIVSGNSASTTGPNIQGTIATNDSNIVGNEASVKLAPLGNYGGPTQTHALLAGSSAVNAGNNCVLTANGCGDNNEAAATDQRGRNRVGQVDIGAFELVSFTVTKTADSNDGVCDSDCSLREAVAAAQSSDLIQFASPLFDAAQTVQVNGQIVIDKSLTIIGRGANLTTVQNIAGASATSRVILTTSGTTVSLSGLTVTGGNLTEGGGGFSGCISSCGGGIANQGSLTITNSAVSGNVVGGTTSAIGGGIINSGTLTLTDSTVANNSARGSDINFGGGIFNLSGTMNVTNSTLSGNSASGSIRNNGGCIYNFNGTMNLNNSTLSGNTASGGNSSTVNQGGGIYINAGTVNVRNTIISGNSAAILPNLFGAFDVDDANIVDNEANVRLAPLGFYGGATMTMPLLSGSTAINAGNNCVLNQSCAAFNAPIALTADQRGAARVGNVDIGAFEANSSANGGNFRGRLPDGLINSPYNFTLVPSNGTTTYAVTGGALPPGMNLTTALAPNAVVSLTGTPTSGGIFNFTVTATNGANTNVTDYRLDIVNPTAAGVSVSGRVMTGEGRGLANAVVILTDANGESRNVRTGSFGFFRFDDIAAGQTVIVEVRSKRYAFAPQVVFVGDEVANLEFVGNP